MHIRPAMIGKDLADVGTTVQEDVFAGLKDVKTIVVGQEALAFHRHKKLAVQSITYAVVKSCVVGGNGKVINLAEKQNIFAVNGGTIDTGSMASGDKRKLVKNGVNVFDHW